MDISNKIILLTDYIEQKVRKEKELEYYTKELEELAMDEDVEVRTEVAKNENTPLPVLEKLSEDRKMIIRDCVAGNKHPFRS